MTDSEMTEAAADDLFICETCGGVSPHACPKCPDGGEGCTVGDIKAAFNSCTTHGALSIYREHYGRHIATLKRSQTQFAKVSAIHLRNLFEYRRKMLGSNE